jgi:hypothetical protein
VSRVERNRGLGRAFEEAVRRKPVARRTRALCKLNVAKKTRLTDYNNDPAVTFADLWKFLQKIEVRLTKCLGTVAQ